MTKMPSNPQTLPASCKAPFSRSTPKMHWGKWPFSGTPWNDVTDIIGIGYSPGIRLNRKTSSWTASSGKIFPGIKPFRYGRSNRKTLYVYGKVWKPNSFSGSIMDRGSPHQIWKIQNGYWNNTISTLWWDLWPIWEYSITECWCLSLSTFENKNDVEQKQESYFEIKWHWFISYLWVWMCWLEVYMGIV